MAIKTRNKREVSFSMASMSDLVFLLLIFFILISTMVSPNAIDVSLPSSQSRTVSPKGPVVAVDKFNNYYFSSNPVDLNTLQTLLGSELLKYSPDEPTGIELQADKEASVQAIVNVYNLVSILNTANNTKHKVILKTAPSQK
ncbi:MAG TPA: biopolymer transporter ExbD [Bacteroidales bacterium]|nr:biopolymer transporter ExbD [Bacteroidales bacterium]HRZ48866.1 biopolymer transporter ExbD [Bacteroidales bacterium]